MLFVKNQSGNIFFTLFGAVAIVGLLGTVIVSTMRGPLSTMVEVQARAQAESEMAIASRLALLEATELANDGDCDSDGFVEPLEYADAGASDAPTGGGFLPSAVASTHVDPWGTQYGYCAWDAGGTTGALACDTSGNSVNERLDGNGGVADETYTIIALVSAGPDQVFGTTCTGGATPSVTKTGDDIVVEYTYATATAATGGLWNIKSGDPATAEIAKNLEVTGGAAFTAGIDLTSSSAALQLGAASMLFPNEVTLATCNSANDGLVRINTASDPDVLQLCDDPNGWVSVGSGLWSSGTGDDIYYNATTPQVGIGTTTPAEALDVVGNIATTANVTAGGNISSVGLAASGNATIGGTLGVTGATTLTTLNATGAVDFDSSLNVDGNSTLVGTLGVTGATTLTTLNATGAVDFDSSLNVDGATTLVGAINAQGDISDSAGDVTISDNLVVTGTSDLQGALSNSTGNVVVSDNVDVSGTLAATVDVTAVDITASGDLSAGSTVIVNGDQLGPALNCSSAQKLEWNNGTGWSCATDLQGGSGGGAPDLEDVLTADNNANGLNAVNLGSVVIGNATARAELDVNDGDFLVTGTYTGTSAVPVSGAGTRMFFQPATAAFRAGNVGGTNWDDGNIGLYSVAMGQDVTASGDYSTAIGQNTTASGNRSFAGGQNTISSGSYSFAFGFNSEASANRSITLGSMSTASGSYSMAFGREVSITGSHSTGFGLGDAVGTTPIVSGASSFGIFMGDQAGVDVTASNTMSLMGGVLAIGSVAASTGGVQDLELDVTGDIGADNYCDASGNNCFTAASVGGSGSGIWEIVSNTARVKSSAGDYTNDDFVFGSPQLADDTDPNHDNRMFFDKSKGAFRAGGTTGTNWDDANVGTYSTVLGTGIASGSYSVALGRDTTSSNSATFASGRDTSAISTYAMAMGQDVTASGANSVGFGLGAAAGVSPIVSGASSFGVFMGDQSGVDVTASNTMSLMGGVLAIGSVAASTGGVQDLELDVTGDIGADNYCDSAGNNCFTAASVGGASLSGLTAATATNTIANANYAQVWNWDTLTTETALSLGSTSITSGNILDINSSATAFTGTMADLTLSGSNAANTGTVLKASVTGALSNAVPLMVTNLGVGDSFRVNDETGDGDASPLVYTADGDFIVGSTQLDDTATGNEDNRMFFDVSKGAFRAGGTTGTEWDDANVGVSSVAMGWVATASGLGSVSLGYGPTASGDYSTATGQNTTASGNRSFVGGQNSISSGSTSFTFGFNSAASANRSITLGHMSTAAGSYSMAFGREVYVSGSHSTGFGLGNSSGTKPIVSGASSFGIFMGDQAGVDVTASNTMSLMGGVLAIGSVAASTGGVQDLELDVTGDIGADNYCDSAGNNCFTAASVGAVALSGLTAATATNTIANANYAQVWNWDTLTTETALSLGSTSITSGNILDINSSATAFTGTMADLTLSGSNAANTGTVLKASVTGALSNAVPLMVTNLGVGDSFRVNDETGDGDTTPFIIDNAGNVGIGTAAPNVALDVIGDIEYTGTITDVSDRRLKDNIKPLENMLERIAKIDTYSFTMKNDEDKRIEFGVMAQELENIFPELVHTSNDEFGTKSVNYIGLIAPLIETSKALHSENMALKAAQLDTNNAVAELSKQVVLLNKIVANDGGRKASMQSYIMLIIGLLGGVGIALIITRPNKRIGK